MNIILYLLNIIQQLYKQNYFLIQLLCKYIPLKQWAFDDSHSPKYQKFKIDKLPKIISFKQEWNWTDLIAYYKKRYNKIIKPVFRHGECDVPTCCTCPQCKAPYYYLMWNDGKKKSQLLCKVCQSLFSTASKGRFSKIYVLRCPHCNNALVHKKIVNTSLYTSVSILSVHTISIIWKKFLRKTLKKTMAKININFTISIGNSI